MLDLVAVFVDLPLLRSQFLDLPAGASLGLPLHALLDLGNPMGKLFPFGPARRFRLFHEPELIQEQVDCLVADGQLGSQLVELLAVRLAGLLRLFFDLPTEFHNARTGRFAAASNSDSSRSISSCRRAIVSRYSDAPSSGSGRLLLSIVVARFIAILRPSLPVPLEALASLPVRSINSDHATTAIAA